MNSSEIVTLAKQIIEQNCSAPNFSIAHLASMMHFHEVYLRKLFHLQLGKSPRAVLKELRMVKARSLLENGELSVAEVAAAVGILQALSVTGALTLDAALPLLFGITIGTSISYYAAVAVLLLYYKRPDALVRLVTKGITLRETLRVNNIGMWGGVLSVVTGLSLFLRAEILNAAISIFEVEEIGFQAYNVQVQVNYVVNAFQASMIAMMFRQGLCEHAQSDLSSR